MNGTLMKLKDKKRQDILNAAVEEFRIHGFEAARVDNIAERGHVSKRTLYKHFDSKEMLFDAIIEIIMAEAAMIPTPDFEPGRPLRDQLISALQSYITLVADARYLSLNRLLAAEYMRDQGLAERILTRPELYVSPVSSILKHAMEKGHLRQADPNFAANQILGLIKNFYFWPQFMLGSPSTSDEHIMADCIDMVLKHYALPNASTSIVGC